MREAEEKASASSLRLYVRFEGIILCHNVKAFPSWPSWRAKDPRIATGQQILMRATGHLHKHRKDAGPRVHAECRTGRRIRSLVLGQGRHMRRIAVSFSQSR